MGKCEGGCLLSPSNTQAVAQHWAEAATRQRGEFNRRSSLLRLIRRPACFAWKARVTTSQNCLIAPPGNPRCDPTLLGDITMSESPYSQLFLVGGAGGKQKAYFSSHLWVLAGPAYRVCCPFETTIESCAGPCLASPAANNLCNIDHSREEKAKKAQVGLEYAQGRPSMYSADYLPCRPSRILLG